MEPTQPVTQTRTAGQPFYVESAGLLSDTFQQAQAAPLDFEQVKRDTRINKAGIMDPSRVQIGLAKNEILTSAMVLQSPEVPKELRAKFQKVADAVSRYCGIKDTWADAIETDSFWSKLKEGFRMGGIRRNLKNETAYMNEAITGLKELLADESISQELRAELTQCLGKITAAGGGIPGDDRTGHELTDDVMAKKGWAQGRVLDASGRSISASGKDENWISRLAKSDKRKEPLFSHEPCREDIQQGLMGDCYFISSLAEAVSKNPAHIKQSMLDNNDGTVTVRMFEKTRDGSMSPVYVTVSKEVRYSGSLGALWVAVMEKAFAAFRQNMARNAIGTDDNDDSKISFVPEDTIDYVYISEGGHSDEATEEFLGKKAEKVITIEEGFAEQANESQLIQAALMQSNPYLRAIKELDAAISSEEHKIQQKLRQIRDPQYQNWVYELSRISEEKLERGKDEAAFFAKRGIRQDRWQAYKDQERARQIELSQKKLRFEKTFDAEQDRLKAKRDELQARTRTEGESYMLEGQVILRSREIDDEVASKCSEGTSQADIGVIQSLTRQAFAKYLAWSKSKADTKTTRELLKRYFSALISPAQTDMNLFAATLGYDTESGTVMANYFLHSFLSEEVMAKITGKISTKDFVMLCLKDIVLNVETMLANLDKLHVQEKKLLSGEYSQYASDLFETIRHGLESGKMLNCGSRHFESDHRGTSGEALAKGIAGGHAYSILGTMESSGRKFIQLRNPWGLYSMKYQQVTEGGETKVVAKEYKHAKDGVFWIELNHFIQMFDQLYQNAS